MCFSSPNIPDPPPPAQEGKQPATEALKRKKGSQVVAGGSLLTSPSGVTNGALNTGAPTLLGG
jgi:hypothetical protein